MGFVRLKKRPEFVSVAKSDCAVNTPYFLLQYLDKGSTSNGQESKARVGFTVTRKVGCAVVRNRVKRRLREVVRIASKEHPECTSVPLDFVLIGRRSAKEVAFNDLKQSFLNAFSKISHLSFQH